MTVETQSPAPVDDGSPPPPARRRPVVRVLSALLVWVPVAAVAGFTAARLAGLDDRYPMIQLIAFTPYVAAGSLALPVGAALLRRWRAAAVAAVAAVLLAAVVLPRAVPDDQRMPAGPAITVMSANMLFGGADATALVRLVRDRHVDVLVLQEFTQDGADRLSAAGVDALLPHRALFPEATASGSAIWSRFPLRDAGTLATRPIWFMQADAAVDVPGAAPLRVTSAHPPAPYGRPVSRYWRNGLAQEPPADRNGPARILLGDFNSTLDHSPLRRLIGTGYRDAADTVGAGLVATWPYDKPMPKVTLDHVLVDRRIGVRSFRVYGIPRSDHRAVVATLVLPAA